MKLCIMREEYSNGLAPIIICSYRCYGVKEAFIRTYESMGVRTDERATKTIIFTKAYIITSESMQSQPLTRFYVTDHNYN